MTSPTPCICLHLLGIQTVGFEQSFRAVVKVHVVILSGTVHGAQVVAQRTEIIRQLSILPEVTC